MDDLIGEFITETTESLSVLDNQLVQLEQNPQDAAILGNIFRIMHTIKGTCGFLGLPRLEAVAHASENVLGKIRDKKLEATPSAVTLILASLDTIKGLIDYLSQHGEEQAGDDSALSARLNHYADTGTIGDGAASVAPASAPAQAGHAAADNAFPHFCGEDDPELKAAMDKILAEAAQPAVAPMNDTPAIEKMVDDGKVTPLSGREKEHAVVEHKDAPKEAGKEPPKESGGGGANQTIRVNIDVLENLMQMVSELVLTRNQLMQIVRTRDDKEFMTPLQQLSHITTELQEGVMKTRMQPISNAWSKFPRLIRDLSLELGKKIDLQMHGAETELDRQLLEVIKDPLTHMVRNSCDHGLETPAERQAAGKPEVGTVTLSAYHEGGHIVIDISDDGRGINIARVKQKAISNGLATEAALEAMSEKQIAQFVFHAGFSTAEKVTSVSGRGVGMDVVKTNIEKIGGALDLDSSWGKGSKVSIKIPLTLAIVPVLLVEACGQKFTIPQINVMELVRVAPSGGLAMECINDALVLRLRDKLLPLAVLSEILGFPIDRTELMQKEMTIAVCKVGGYDLGIAVDKVYDTEEIVVKPVAAILKHLSVYSGNTILGDGSVIMILDPAGIVRMVGNPEMAVHAQAAELQQNKRNESERLVSFLMFHAGKSALKAVPLELVSRLEEIDVASIEIAGDKPVVQYRGELMRLLTLDNDFALPDSGPVNVIVFSYDKKVLGLLVSEIIDIVHAPFAIKLASKEAKGNGYLGSMVIAGKSADVVDVSYLLADLVDHAVTTGDISRQKAAECQVLLVEDSPFFRNLTVPFLSAAGYKVTAAEDANVALQLLTKDHMHFDMIVTDIEMPGMNGFEFASACRATPEINGTPIIAYTASLSHEVMQRSKEVGMNDCIVKTDRVGLLDSMARYLALAIHPKGREAA